MSLIVGETIALKQLNDLSHAIQTFPLPFASGSPYFGYCPSLLRLSVSHPTYTEDECG